MRALACLVFASSALFLGCSRGGDPLGGGGILFFQVPVRVFLEGSAFPAGAGVLIRFEGNIVGVTDPMGEAVVNIPLAASSRRLQAFIPGIVGGSAILPTPDGKGMPPVEIFLEGKGLAQEADLVLVEADGGVIAEPFTAFNLEFRGENLALIRVAGLNFVTATEVDGDSVDITDLFMVTANGTLRPTDVGLLQAALGDLRRQIELEVSAQDEDEIVLNDVVSFRVARSEVSGVVEPPPSTPALPVDGLELDFSLIGSSLTFTAVSDTSGLFSFGVVPDGTYAFEATTMFMGQTFNAVGNVFVNGPTSLVVVPSTTADIQAGVQMVSVATGTGTRATPDPALLGRRRDHRPRTIPGGVRGGGTSVTVVSAAENVNVTDSAVLIIPAGTNQVRLSYEVCTDEYPTFVLEQSEFNDNWEVGVLGPNGTLLSYTSRNVNSQIFIPPFWQPNGCTGVVVVDIDVSAFNSGTPLTLFAGARNIGDSSLPTSVMASLAVGSDFRIVEATPDMGSDFYSIPRFGSLNFDQRFFDLALARPSMTTLTNVRVEFLSENETLISTLVNEPTGTLAQELGLDLLRVQVTNGPSNPSTVTTMPPPADRILYRFQVTADVQGMSVQDGRTSAVRRSLWPIPDGFQRFGLRETGGDDWCSSGTFGWLQTNAGLIPAINDVSGEHGRDIGQTTHRRGTDIDIYHFTNLVSGALNGTLNFIALKDAVEAAQGGNMSALATAVAWFQAERAGLGPILGNSEVAQVRVGLGPRSGVLPGGWYRALLLDGMVMQGANVILDLGIGPWTAGGMAKLRHDDIHNTKSQIALDAAEL
jgi:hypothetical protein